MSRKIKQQQHCKIFTLSADRKEYERMSYQLTKTQDGLRGNALNDLMLSGAAASFEQCQSVVLVHDGCDIRKPYARQMEGLSKVRSLEGNLINGYDTFNTVAIGPQRLHLVNCTPIGEQANKQIAFEQISRVSQAFKAANADMVLTHLIDREADDACFFAEIEILQDRYIIRARANRVSDVQGWDEEKQKSYPVKLINKQFDNSFEQRFDKFMLVGKCHQQVLARIEYERVWVGGKWRYGVKVRLFNREGKPLYKDAILLITNIVVDNEQMALYVYKLYLQRSKIEGVFKFLKQSLGWEQFQVQQLVAIKNLILLCFFIGSYFYELEPELTKNEFMITLCQMAGGKGKVTRHFFLKGLQILAHAQMAQHFFEKENLSLEQIQQLFDLIN